MQQIKNTMNAKEQAIAEAKAFLENEGFQVYNVGSIDLLGAFNNHVRQIGQLQGELEKLKAKKTIAKQI